MLLICFGYWEAQLSRKKRSYLSSALRRSWLTTDYQLKVTRCFLSVSLFFKVILSHSDVLGQLDENSVKSNNSIEQWFFFHFLPDSFGMLTLIFFYIFIVRKEVKMPSIQQLILKKLFSVCTCEIISFALHCWQNQNFTRF